MIRGGNIVDRKDVNIEDHSIAVDTLDLFIKEHGWETN